MATLETCANCGETIGKLETPHIHAGNVVCERCAARLAPGAAGTIAYASPRPVISDREPIRAYGLTRGGAWLVALAGLFLTPALIGIPMLVWGILAEREVRRLTRIRGCLT